VSLGAFSFNHQSNKFEPQHPLAIAGARRLLLRVARLCVEAAAEADHDPKTAVDVATVLAVFQPGLRKVRRQQRAEISRA
jgi:hypothetical protein